MKKLLIMASLFWPQKNGGGPPVSIMNLVTSIKDRFEIYIISNNHEVNDDKPLKGIKDGWNDFSFGKALYIQHGEHTPKTVFGVIEQVRPDVIYQNSFFSANDLYPVLKYKKKNHEVKVIIAPRGEFYPERFKKGHVKKKMYAIVFRYSGLLKGVYFQGTGEDECRQEKEFLSIPDDHIYNVQNLSLVQDKRKEIEKQSGELRLVYIARIHPSKNILNAIQWLSGIEGTICYDIYGSIEDTEYWDECKLAISKESENVNVEYKGVIDHSAVPEVLSQYHAYYMPTMGENYGHSIVEAMMLGRPVIISDQTPWTSVNGNGGYAIPLEKEANFKRAISELIACDHQSYMEMSNKIQQYIMQKLNVDEIIKQYINMFDGDEQ